MSLQDKYKELIDSANSAGSALSVVEENGTLIITGTVPNASVHDNLFDIYNRIDNNGVSGDLIMNLEISNETAGATCTVTTEETALNVRSGPSTDDTVIGAAAHGEQVTLIEKTNEQWWKIRTSAGLEGYAYSQYLTAN